MPRLFAGLAIPNSHATLTALPDAAECLELRREGFAAVKIKATPEIASQPRSINCLVASLGGIKLRLDFNFTLDQSAFLAFAAGLSAETRQAIDFIEDPCPFDPEVWRHLRKSTGLPLAADRIDGPIAPDVCDFRILKPACQEIFPQAGRFVITSYMDHPVGQLFAAWEAAQRRATVDLCGLLTHRLFEPNAFSESLTSTGPQLFPPSGTGLGWDALLMSLPWKRLDAQ
jgi:O-succinylbenzoate synthase